jgi:PAS domain S-box-containing protein
VVTFSEHLAEIFGLPPGEDRQTVESVVERTAPSDRSYFADVVREIAGGSRDATFERRIQRPDGEQRYLRSNSFIADVDPDGTPTRVVGVCRDVTAERREQERRERFRKLYVAERQVAERLRQLDELKFAFMSTVSHDLRSPLTTVIGSASTIRDLGDSLDRETRDSLLDQTIDQAAKLDRMLADLLDLERLRRGRVESLRRPVALCELVRGSTEEVGADARIELDLPAHEIVAEVDPSKFERIVENLVRSAVQGTHDGSPVRVVMRATEDRVRLAVEDHGEPIPAHLRARLFEPYARGEAGELLGRSGLSLAIVSRYARLHDGRAWIEASSDGGNRFVVELPRVAPSADAPPAVPFVIERVASAHEESGAAGEGDA